MPTPPPPFYFDWQFWAAAVALLALVLSQLPPLLTLLRRGRLTCEVYSRAHITHHLGNPNSQWHLIIENTGGAPVRVKGLSVTITRTSSGQTFELPAQNYLRSPEAEAQVMFTPFTLQGGQEWAHVVNFFQLFSRDDEKVYRWLVSEIRGDISAQREQPGNADKLLEVSNPDLVKAAHAFFQKNFKWEHGEYEAVLTIRTAQGKADLSKRYRFSLFESESKELVSYAEGYRHGAGIYYNGAGQSGLLMPLTEV